MPAPLELTTPILLRELEGDDVLAQSLIKPELAVVAPPGDVRIELELLLSSYFAGLLPQKLARFSVVGAPELRTVSVLVARPELKGRLRITTPLDVACIVVRAQGEGSDQWVYLVPLDVTVHVRAGEDFETIVSSEVQRVAAARELDGAGYVALLPAPRTWAESLTVPFASKAFGSTSVSGVRAESEAARRRGAEELLNSVGSPLREHGRARPLLLRDRELASLSALLTAKQRASVLLVGEAGVGKSALLASFFDAQKALGPEPRVYVTSAALLLAGMSGFGQWQERLERVLSAAELLDAILVIEDMCEGGGPRAQLSRRARAGFGA